LYSVLNFQGTEVVAIGSTAVKVQTPLFLPFSDSTTQCGGSSNRWSVVYSATGTINTSDQRDKRDIEALSAAETLVAQDIKALVKKFRWKDAVAAKGNAARKHVGWIAQEVAQAFVARGLDPHEYAMFCKDTWWEVPGAPAPEPHPDGLHVNTPEITASTPGAVQVTRYGLRHDQVLAFLVSAL
jgi:hypothetical protein